MDCPSGENDEAMSTKITGATSADQCIGDIYIYCTLAQPSIFGTCIKSVVEINILQYGVTLVNTEITVDVNLAQRERTQLLTGKKTA